MTLVRIALYVPCFRCLGCDIVTETETEMKAHDCVFPFVCRVCKKGFKFGRGVWPHVCGRCEKLFGRFPQ